MSRVLIGLLLASAAAASLAFPASAENRRVRIVEPGTALAGTFFNEIDRLHKLDQKELDSTNEAVGGPQGFETALKQRRDLPADQLARDLMQKENNAKNVSLQISFMRATIKDDESFSRAMQNASASSPGPDGKTYTLTPLQALQAFVAGMRLDDAALAPKAAKNSLAGRYTAVVKGSCPISGGPIELVQHDYLYEGVRDGKLVLFGVIGLNKLFMSAVEARYATIATNDSGAASLQAPDAELELFEATVNTRPLALAGTLRRDCDIELAPQKG